MSTHTILLDEPSPGFVIEADPVKARPHINDFIKAAQGLGITVELQAYGTWDVGRTTQTVKALKLRHPVPVRPARRYWYLQTLYGEVRCRPMADPDYADAPGSMLLILLRRVEDGVPVDGEA